MPMLKVIEVLADMEAAVENGKIANYRINAKISFLLE